MNFDEYQRLAQRTSNTKTRSSKLENGILGLLGEAGEVSEPLKKYLFQGHELNKEKILDECGDVLWYLAEIATALNAGLSDIARRNIEKLRARYPQGFEAQRSIHREG